MDCGVRGWIGSGNGCYKEDSGWWVGASIVFTGYLVIYGFVDSLDSFNSLDLRNNEISFCSNSIGFARPKCRG